MKRTSTILSVLAVCILTFSFANGQEKKREQKIKVIVSGKSGDKVIIDTTITNSGRIDSIITKDGNVIYFSKNEVENKAGSGKQYKVIASVDNNGDKTESRYIYVNDDNMDSSAGDDVFDIMISDEDFDNNVETTKYVIAKDGITVSVEGSDDAKVKEIVKEIEKKLDVSGDHDSQDKVVKEVEKTVVKKK
jgi:hypothetical protein